MATLTWLHLSDLHACHPRTGWDAARVQETLIADLEHLQREHSLAPDLIFFTGDAAFGEIGNDPEETLRGQLQVFAAFLDEVRKTIDPAFPWENVFLVPGNHDVNRNLVEGAQTEWLDRRKRLDEVVEIIRQGSANLTWRRLMERLGDYRDFLDQHGRLAHLVADRERLIYGAKRRISGLSVGIGGFNSAWSCGRDGERGRLWMAGRFQQEVLRQQLSDADLRIALTHHPPAWLVEQESPRFGRRLRQDFHFLLHGHDHQEWVEEGSDGYTVVAAGACYEGSEKDNGYSLVRLDLTKGEGQVWLRRFDADGGGWVPRAVHKRTDELGVWPISLPWAAELQDKVGKAERRPSPGKSAPAASVVTPASPALTRYLRRLRAAHRGLPVAGFETRVRVPIRIEEIYIPLRAQLFRRAFESEWKELGAGRQLEAEDREIRFDESLALARQYELPGLAVLGDPGSGKTTLLKHFVLAATDPEAEAATLRLPQDTVPVFIALRRLSRPTAGLESALAEAVAAADPALDAAVFAHELLARDRLLVLVDGLDELEDESQRVAVSRWLERAVTQLPESSFVVTSRYAGYKGDARLDGRFLELHIRDLNESEARSFAVSWYRAVESQVQLGRDPEVAEAVAVDGAGALAKRIFDEDDPRTASLRRLARNPLMLQILCLVHRDRKSLPERRVELYHECVLVLLELWRRAKKLPVETTAREALKLLQPLAWGLHAEGKKEAPLEEVLPYLEEPLREIGAGRDAAGPLLAAIRDQSGVLVSLGEGAFGFLHLSFQEYLAARHVQDRMLAEPELLGEVASHFGEPWWREVILLAVGLDNPSLFEPLMAELLRRQRLHRDPALAGDCLRDALATTATPFVEALASRVGAWEERYAALQLLKSKELAAWPEVDAERGKSGREVVAGLARTDPSEQVQGLARELLGAEKVTRPEVGRVRPQAGEERLHAADGSVLVYVPGGEYVLGAEDLEELGFDAEFAAGATPVHRARLSPFWIGKYPLTNEQYAKFLEAEPQRDSPKFWEDREFNQPEQPVVGVSWHEARAYCGWAGLALPTEAQWEAAARGEDQRHFPWGNEVPSPERANFYGREGKTTPVGAFPAGAGPFGTLDQAGNVWEWCSDGWDRTAYQGREGVLDPSVSPEGDDPLVALRGGSWAYPAQVLAAAIRDGDWAWSRYQDIGFRVVLLSVSEHA